jgi:hypothetical protein
MKTNCFINSVVVAVGLVAFSAAGCAQKEQTADASPPPAKDSAPTVVTTTLPGATPTAQVAAATSPDVAIAQWIDIKDCTYDMRPKFFSGLKRLEARVDEHISKLSIRRAAMKSTANTQDWDFAMKEMENARTNLKSMGEELHKAPPETWDEQKDKVGQAWVRAQEAYGKVKSSTTS